jgi:hypothetical protein
MSRQVITLRGEGTSSFKHEIRGIVECLNYLSNFLKTYD